MIYRQIITLLIILTFVSDPVSGVIIGENEQLTVNKFRYDNPNIDFEIINYQKYKSYVSQYAQNRNVYYLRDNQYFTSSEEIEEQSKESESSTQEATPKSRNSGSGSSGNLGNGGGGDGALILLVVIGLVVVAVLVIAGGKIVYDAMVNKKKFPYLIAAGTTYSTFTNRESVDSDEDSDTEGKVLEQGTFQGIKISFGLIEKGKKGSLGVALTTEFGLINSDLQIESASGNGDESIDLIGNYILLGPSFRAYPPIENRSIYFEAELLMGTTEHKEVGNLTLGRLSVALGNYGYHFGMHIGAMYIGLKPGEGAIRKGSDYSYIWGADIGYQF